MVIGQPNVSPLDVVWRVSLYDHMVRPIGSALAEAEIDMKVLLNLKAVIDRQKEDLSAKDAQLHERNSQIERVSLRGRSAG